MRRAVSWLFGFVVFGSAACQGLWGMHPFEGGEVVAVGGGLAGAGSGGQGPGCRSGADCPGAICWAGDCVAECDPAKPGFCDGATLFLCNATGDGLVSESGAVCATPELCDRGRFQGVCPPPTCEAGDYQCYVPTEGPIRLRICPDDRTEWKTHLVCESPTEQCSPDDRGCFELGMDETEVTRGNYEAFLAEVESLDARELADLQPTACEWNTTFAPDADCLDKDGVCTGDCEDHPQVCVDWCDALAYCRAQGKSLCGTLGDQKNVTFDASLASDPSHGSWANACSGVPPGSCPSALRMTTSPVHEACRATANGYTNLWGISGNVSEWEYACQKSMDAPSDEAGYCFTRGGSFVDGAPDCLSTVQRRRSEVHPDLGFRCCALEMASSTWSGGAGASSK